MTGNGFIKEVNNVRYFDTNENTHKSVEGSKGAINVNVISGGGGGGSLADGSVTTEKIADGAVTDEKLAKQKIDMPESLTPLVVLGTSRRNNNLGLVPYAQSPAPNSLVMYGQEGTISVPNPVFPSDAVPKKYIDDLMDSVLQKTSVSSIEPLEGTATNEDIINKLNEIILALQG